MFANLASLPCQKWLVNLHIPDLILKLYLFLKELFPLRQVNWYPLHARAKEKTNNLNVNFNYVNHTEKSENTFIAKRKITSGCNITICTDYMKYIYLLFSLNFARKNPERRPICGHYRKWFITCGNTYCTILYPELSVLTLSPISVNAYMSRILAKSVY